MQFEYIDSLIWVIGQSELYKRELGLWAFSSRMKPFSLSAADLRSPRIPDNLSSSCEIMLASAIKYVNPRI
eukprot:Seg2427.4 transcript_id=Seg2427.4/GoldUCD/mRNA.D3Y31 product="hypothetical protein" pseudo=true protein_id=Seg2427.4/GoldUCD/D3Y31